jgi:hypothetical protein
MWVTKIDVKTDNKEEDVIFELFTDPVKDVRYKGTLKFALPKGAEGDQVEKVVAEVFKIQPADDAKDAKQDKAAPAGQQTAQSGAPAAAQPPPAPAAETPAAPLPDIPPPPPPVDQPPPPPATIGLGQTKDQVVASLGQPQKIVNLGKKEMYYYKDLKVIFTAGKVSDVQ